MSETKTNINLVNSTKLQIVVVVRYKPSKNLTDASSILENISDQGKAISDCVDKGLSYIPGLLVEQKQDVVQIDEDYNYFDSYAKHWDKILKETENNLLEMNNKNKFILYEFDNYQNLEIFEPILENKIKSAIIPLNNETYGIHFIGLAQGGNLAVNTAMKLKNSLGANGSIDSIFCVGTALQGNAEKIDFLNNLPNIINFKSSFDLSSNCIQFAKEPDKIINTIKMANQTPIKFMYSKLILKTTKILSLLLKGLNISISNGFNDIKHIIDSVKSDIKEIIDDIIKLAKHILESFQPFIKLPKIDQKFDDIFRNPNQITQNAIHRLEIFFEDLKKNFVEGVKKGKVSLSNMPIEKIFNLFTPIVLLIDKCLHGISIDLKEAKPQNELKEFTAKNAFQKTICQFDRQMSTKDAYQNVIIKAAENKKMDQLNSLVATAKQNTNILSDDKTSDIQRDAQGISLSRILKLPMIQKKIELINQLLDNIPFLKSTNSFDKIKTDTITAPLIKIVNIIKNDFEFDKTDNGKDEDLGLQVALNRLDKSIIGLKQLIDPEHFKIDKKYNSLYFIYNSHNVSLLEMPKELRKNLDMATNIFAYKLAKGFEYNELDGTYKAGKDGISTKEILTVEESKEKQN